MSWHELRMACEVYRSAIALTKLRGRVERLERLCFALALVVLVLAITGSLIVARLIWRLP